MFKQGSCLGLDVNLNYIYKGDSVAYVDYRDGEDLGSIDLIACEVVPTPNGAGVWIKLRFRDYPSNYMHAWGGELKLLPSSRLSPCEDSFLEGLMEIIVDN